MGTRTHARPSPGDQTYHWLCDWCDVWGRRVDPWARWATGEQWIMPEDRGPS
jgi:hypothetical protein